MIPKEELRKLYKQRRSRLGAGQKVDFSRRITLNSLDYVTRHKDCNHIHVFLPIERLNEVNTMTLLDGLMDLGKNVYSSVSTVADGELKTVRLYAGMEYVEDSLGITIPKDPVYVDDKLIDLVFVPLLAVDRKGNRLGYGMGFYDRFLSKLASSVKKIGLSYFEPEDHIPAEKHDIPLDACIYPDGITVFSD